jgi:hypothetical protein
MRRAIRVGSLFSRRAWKVLPALAVGIVLAVFRANAQPVDPGPPLPLVPPSTLTPYERTQEIMRRLNLPPNPALKGKVDEAFAARNACFEQAMRPLVKKGLRDSELAKAACRACDKQVIATAKIFF